MKYWIMAPLGASESEFDQVWNYCLKNMVIGIGYGGEKLGDLKGLEKGAIFYIHLAHLNHRLILKEKQKKKKAII